MSNRNIMETERLELRPLTMDDLDAHSRIYSDRDVRKVFSRASSHGENRREHRPKTRRDEVGASAGTDTTRLPPGPPLEDSAGGFRSTSLRNPRVAPF
jgi:RimJ/RimL family protein N-acetyltransferase